MYAECDTFAIRTAGAERNQYTGRKLSHRWPLLVREAAVEGATWRADVDGVLAATEPMGQWTEPPTQATDPTDPLPDAEDEIFLLGERCAQAYMQADALHYRAMKLLAEFDRRSGWQDTGFSSTAEWLAWRIGIKPGAARERLRTALALEQLPETSEAMKNGELSFTKVRAITRVASPDNETALLEFARAGSAAALERVVRGWKALDRKSELTAEQIRHRSRRFSAWVDDDGMVVVKGRLDPEVGALFMRAVEAASDALYRKKARDGETRHGEPEDANLDDANLDDANLDGTNLDDTNLDHATLEDIKPEQRRADAVGLIAERALGAGFGVRGGEDAEHSDGDHPEEDSTPISGSRAERYQVMLHVDMGTLQEEGEPGRSELEDGTRVSAETSRRVSCDTGLVKIFHGADGQVVGAGRRNRTISPSMRRALEARDRGCRFPGCGLRFTDAHHVKHWADGGETSLRNMVLLCKAHHRAIHEGGVRVCIDRKQQVVFFTPRGRALFEVPAERDRPMVLDYPEPGNGPGGVAGTHPGPEKRGPEELAPEKRGQERRGPDQREPDQREPDQKGPLTPDIRQPIGPRPNHLAGASRWKRDKDIPWEVEARAWEALDSG